MIGVGGGGGMKKRRVCVCVGGGGRGVVEKYFSSHTSNEMAHNGNKWDVGRGTWSVRLRRS